jgi:peroxiredoxin
LTAQQRVQAQRDAARGKKSGFNLRPLDLALLVIGVLVVGFVVWSIMSGNNQGTVANQPTGGGPNAQSTPLPVGAVAPDFTLPGADGQTYTLSNYKGKVAVLEFFAPWCPHCQDDAPMFNSTAQNFQGKDVQFFAISASPRGKDNESPISMDDITWFRDTFQVNFPMLLDKELKYAGPYSIMFYPTVYIVDKEGKIASQPAGFFTWQNGEPVSTRAQELNQATLTAEIEKFLK